MSFIDLNQLPFVGMSYEFVGETQGAPFSAYIVNGDTLLRQIDVHASPRFIQTNLA